MGSDTVSECIDGDMPRFWSYIKRGPDIHVAKYNDDWTWADIPAGTGSSDFQSPGPRENARHVWAAACQDIAEWDLPEPYHLNPRGTIRPTSITIDDDVPAKKARILRHLDLSDSSDSDNDDSDDNAADQMPRLISRSNNSSDVLADTGAHTPFMARPAGGRLDAVEGDLFRYRVITSAEAAVIAAARSQEPRPNLFSTRMTSYDPSRYQMDTSSTFDRPPRYSDDVPQADTRSMEPLVDERPAGHSSTQAERPRDGAGRDD